MKRKMRIAIIANNFQEDYIIELLNGLAGETVQIDFIGSEIYDPELINKNINLLKFRRSHSENDGSVKKTLHIFRYYFRLIHYLLFKNAKVIHVQWLRFNFIEGVLFSLIMKMAGKKVVYTAHDVLPHMKENLYNRALFKIIYSVSDHIIVHTDFIKERLKKEFHTGDSKVSVLKHGVYTVKNPGLTTREARMKYQINQEARVFLFFGIITKYKGVDLLFRAFDAFQKVRENSYLVIGGSIAKEYAGEFEELNRKYDHPKMIKIYRRVENDEVPFLFKAADVVVLPYLEASQSGVLFMSYAHGRPVIAPDLGGFRTDVMKNKTGLLFKPGSSESLSETMSAFDSSFGEYFKNSEDEIIHFSNENYSWRKTGKELIRIYEELVKS